MKNFSLVPTSEGPRREFKVNWGLRAGYGPSGRIYDLEEAIRAAHRWMIERDARAEPFLSGMFTRGEVVYAGSEAPSSADIPESGRARSPLRFVGVCPGRLGNSTRVPAEAAPAPSNEASPIASKDIRKASLICEPL